MAPALFPALVASLIFASPSALATAPDPQKPEVCQTPLDSFVASEARRLGHPGLAVGVVVGDRLVLARGFGVRNRRTGGEVTPDTVFRLASITKVISGLALLALREDGKLTLEDPVVRFLPELASAPAFKGSRAITLRHLVTHSSGLPRDIPAGGVRTEASFLARVASVRAEGRAGEHTRYSNLGMGLVGPIVHRASGKAFRDFVRERILAPLGMSSTVWERREIEPARLATGHVKNKETGKLEPEASEWVMGAAEAFGGLYSSVEDMAKLLRFELSAWRPDGEGGRPVSAASLRESQTLAIGPLPEPPRYGVAWLLGDDPDFGPRVEHTGATDEYSASVAFFPRQGVGAVVLSNAAFPADVEALNRRILRYAAGPAGLTARAGCGREAINPSR